MLNFLPQNNKKKIILEYLSRILIMLLIFLFFAVVLLISLFIPSIIFSKYKNQTVKNQLESIKITNINENQDPIELIKKINTMIGILSGGNTVSLLMSNTIQKIISLKNKDIEILSISISDNSTSSEKIIINGIAKTRDGLTLFDKDLKNDGLFYSVDLPISNLIKNTNAQFTITLIYNKK